MNILIADDNRDFADGLAAVLECNDHTVSVVYSGQDAIDCIKHADFSAVFLDVKLVDISGIDVFHRTHVDNPNARFFLITGFRVSQVFSQVVDSGGVVVVRDPVTQEGISNALTQSGDQGVVLVASEDGDVIAHTTRHLQSEGRLVLTARSGEDIVDKMKSHTADVLVLDLAQPVLGALEIYMDLKEHGLLRPIIVIFREYKHSDKADVLKSIWTTGCLFKPFKPETVLEALNTISETRKMTT